MDVSLALPIENIVGESIVWDDQRNCLLWVDIIGKAIHRFDPATGSHESWQTPDFVTSIGLREDGGAVVGLTKRICLWDFDETFQTLSEIEPDQPGNRLNEGVVGSDGAFWVGTMQNNIAPDGSPKDMDAETGRLYRCTSDGGVFALSDDLFALTNTLVWPEDGGLITADTGKNALYRYDYDPTNSSLSNRRAILSDFDRGLPDGSTMDAEGYLWNCRVVGGACLIRFDPDGQIDRVLDLPCSWPTSCTFGGEDLDTLYVTSARFTMDDTHLEREPQEGGLFAVKPGVTGRVGHRFAI